MCVLNARAGRTIIQSDFPPNFAAVSSRKEKKKETNERKIHSCDDDDKQEVKTCRKIIKHFIIFKNVYY